MNTITSIIDSVLSRLSNERTKWQFEREPMSRTSVLSFRCRAVASFYSSDHFLEHVGSLEQYLIRQAHELFVSAHNNSAASKECLPIIECGRCGSFVDVVNTAEMSPEQMQVYSERQALEWMKRAQAAGLSPLARGR